jgi:hypothetical protein
MIAAMVYDVCKTCQSLLSSFCTIPFFFEGFKKYDEEICRGSEVRSKTMVSVP